MSNATPMVGSAGAGWVLSEEERKRIGQAIGMLAALVMTPEHEHEAGTIELALQAAGWSLITLRDAKPGETIGEVTLRLCERHNASVGT